MRATRAHPALNVGGLTDAGDLSISAQFTKFALFLNRIIQLRVPAIPPDSLSSETLIETLKGTPGLRNQRRVPRWRGIRSSELAEYYQRQ